MTRRLVLNVVKPNIEVCVGDPVNGVLILKEGGVNSCPF